MIFHHYAPVKLCGLVEQIWEQQSDKPSTWTILPSGKVELIFRIGSPDPFMQQAKRIKATENPMSEFCFLSGLHTKPLILKYNHFHYMGIQMKPIAVNALFGLHLREIRDYYLEGDILLRDLARIEDQLNTLSNFRARAMWLEAYLLDKLADTPELHTAFRLQETIHKMIATPGPRQRSVEDLLGYSRSHSFRLFTEWFGVSAKAYEKLTRFVHSVHRLHRTAGKLTDTGLDLGYYDQSHFIRSFRAFGNMTPGEYQKRMGMVPGQFAG